MTFSTPESASCGAGAFEVAASLVYRSRRRAHLGGRSVDGRTHAIFARRQFEHGDFLSQRTLRLRHTTQLRNFAVDRELALFSEPKAEAADAVAPDPCILLLIGYMAALVVLVAWWSPCAVRKLTLARFAAYHTYLTLPPNSATLRSK